MRDVESIQADYQELNNKLHKALSQMVLTDKITAIRDSIKALQLECPHDNGQYNFSNDDECPYCGKRFKR